MNRGVYSGTDDKRQGLGTAVDAGDGMSDQQSTKTGASARDQQEADVHSAPGWTTETVLVREFDRSVDSITAVVSTVEEAIERWPELSETPPLYQFVDIEHLDGLFKTTATNDSRWIPSAEFPFQSCLVTVLYGSSLRVTIERDP